MSGGLQNYQPFHSALKLFSITIGTALQVPRVNAGGTAIEWADQSGGSGAVATDTIWDAAGDLVVGTGSNTAARLAKGTALQTLRVNAGATALEWATNSISTIVGVSSTKAEFDSACSDGNFLYVGDVTTNATHTGDATGSTALTVVAINGTLLSGLATGILKNTTTTGVPSIAVAGDFPTLNQSTTGSAATLTTARAIYGNNFDGSAALTQIIASTFGGTGNGFTKFSGPTTTERTKTLRDANDTIVEVGGSYTITGTWTNVTLVNPTLGKGSYTSLQTTDAEAIPSGSTTTFIVKDSNQFFLDLSSASGTAHTLTLDVTASTACQGTVTTKQHGSVAKEITVASGATVVWLGTKPLWISDGFGTFRVISFKYLAASDVLLLGPSEVST